MPDYSKLVQIMQIIKISGFGQMETMLLFIRFLEQGGLIKRRQVRLPVFVMNERSPITTLGLFPTTSNRDSFWANGNATVPVYPLRGASWVYDVRAGSFGLNLVEERRAAYTSIGFLKSLQTGKMGK